MNRDGIEKLTQRQRECLRLVPTLRSSKAIGLRLGLSGSTVSNHLKAAMTALNVSDRYEAARLLSLGEGDFEVSPCWTSPTPDIAAARIPETLSWSADDGDDGRYEREAGKAGSFIAEEQLPYIGSNHPHQWPRPPVPTAGSKLNDLTIAHRLIWIVAIAVAAMLGIVGALAGLVALTRLLTSGSAL